MWGGVSGDRGGEGKRKGSGGEGDRLAAAALAASTSPPPSPSPPSPITAGPSSLSPSSSPLSPPLPSPPKGARFEQGGGVAAFKDPPHGGTENDAVRKLLRQLQRLPKSTGTPLPYAPVPPSQRPSANSLVPYENRH